MKHYFITGTGKGIGKALAERFLKEENTIVYGISRNNSINHKNFRFIPLDLSKINEVKIALYSIFIHVYQPEKIVLVNNAGVLDNPGYIGEVSNNGIEELYNINLISPAILVNAFIHNYKDLPCSKLIMNISSGAGKRPMDGWAGYCSSKAALDMFSQVVGKEQQIREQGIKIFSIAPGVVETNMQEKIRKTTKDNFSGVERFHEMKEQGVLDSTENVAEKLFQVIENDSEYNDIELDVRNL